MKQWTAEDIRMEGKLEMSKGKNEATEDVLRVVRGYRFVDGEGNNVPGLGRQRLVRVVLWDDVPTGIKAAFQWTRDQALIEQGME